ncbi:MAG: HEAT repeat domain-containing protein [Planctomycetota bacterium]|jgi:HEAT repeat protein
MQAAGTILFLLLLADPDALLQSRDVKSRLAGIEQIRKEGHADAEELLHKATKDKDWEVVHRAVDALAVRGTKKSTRLLLDVAVRGPTRKVRRAAALALEKIDPEVAAAALARKLKGETVIRAAEALELIAEPVAGDALEKVVKRADSPARAHALLALGALRDEKRIKFFGGYLKDADIEVRAAAAEALARVGRSRAIGPLRAGLSDERMPAVMERRHIAAIYTLLLAEPDEEQRAFSARMLVTSLGMGGTPKVTAAYARMLGELGRKEKPAGPVDDYERALVSVGLTHADLTVRSAAVAALARLGRAVDRLEDVARSDTSHRVRFHALRAVDKIRGGEAIELFLDRLANDRHASVREEAAFLCSRRKLKEAAPALVAALKDRSWEVCTSAAVSLGKLEAREGLQPLQRLLKEKDWRRRGAGVVGLGWIHKPAAVDSLIDALRDKEIAVARTALEFLRHNTGQALDAKQKAWREWWGKVRKTFSFRDPGEEAREAKKYGYAVTRRGVYEDLDIVVLQTRKGGDNIQFLLDDYGIEHRIIRAASVKKVGLHPHALFVANCPGEITKSDVERLQWYVRAGGYLFASCWALTHTVQAAFPDVVRKLHTRAQIVDTVGAQKCPSNSPLIEGVFDGVTLPLYELMGSHVIDVIDPERFEVLIDSPECATRWGDGNLAGWFTIGHGLILDSANHFDLQGMSQQRLRDEKERMAFAVDHLGYGYEELRKLRGEGVFAKQPLAVKRTRDLSIFRFITTFVRQKRLADED